MESIYVHKSLEDCAFAEVSETGDEPFIYQYIRAEGYRSLCVERNIELLDAASWRIRHCCSGLSVADVARAVERLLVRNAYPSDKTNVVMLRSYAESDYALLCCGTSLYKGLDLRAYRPNAITVEVGGLYAGLPTSVAYAETKLLAEYVRMQGAGAFVAVDASGRIVSVDGATAFVVRHGRITVSRLSPTVEAEIVLQALERAGREVEVREIMVDELSTADEVWGVDHRGITSLTECDGRVYSDIIADATARRL